MDGLGMMLKSMGIDLPKLTNDFKTLQDGVIQTLKTIDARLQHLEAMTEDLWKAQHPNQQPPTRMQPQPQPAEQPQAQPQPNNKPVLQLVPQNQPNAKQPQPQQQLST